MRARDIAVACMALVAVAGAGQLELSKKWIQQNMNHATTGKITFHIKEAKKSVNKVSSGAADGDLHIAGSSDQVGLPMVAEIINGAKSPQAVKFAQSNPGKDVTLEGVWRLWFEHPPTGKKQKQFANNPLTGPATNPDHMFEVHPISVLDTNNLSANLARVDGYEAKSNADTFNNYETRTLDSWKVTADSVILESKKAGYNYADFVVRLKEAPINIQDDPGGANRFFMAQADVLDVDCSVIMDSKKKTPVISGPRRMVFVNNDAPKVLSGAKAGSTFHVMGIPRVNLERLVFYLNHPDQLDKKVPLLPYEMIIIGAEPQACKGGSAPKGNASTAKGGTHKKK